MVQVTPSPFTPTAATVKVAQARVDLYEGLAQATGQSSIQWLSPSVAHKILGVWLAPDGNSKQQVKKLQKKTEEWADRVRSGHIPKVDAWFYYTTTIQKSLQYPLLASTLSEEECIKIETPVLTAAQQHSGPLDSLGLDCPMLYSTSLFQKLRTLLDHGTSPTITGQHLWCGLESHNWEFGCGTSLFSLHYPAFQYCIPNTWIKHVWKQMWEAGTVVAEDTPTISLQQENNCFLLLTFAKAGWYRSKGSPVDLPVDWEPAICYGTDTKIISTGSAPRLPSPSLLPTPLSFYQRCTQGPTNRTWAAKSISTDDDDAYVAAAIRDGLAIAVSDSSYKEGHSRATFAIKGACYNHHQISGSCTAPGYVEEHDAYCGELSGLYSIVTMVENLCTHYDIASGTITVA
eukprot:14815757-Ditylum_brightwellii.AAC.1